jgi:hypothetical protein
MSNSNDTLTKQIAALEAALALSLPDATRTQIQHDLDRLRAQRDTGAVHGVVDVTGTLYGNAIGVNLGTAQNAIGAAPPAAPGDRPSALSQEAIDDQRELLEAHRRTLAIYLKQQAALGSAYAPPGIANGIREARDAIKRANGAGDRRSAGNRRSGHQHCRSDRSRACAGRLGRPALPGDE